MKTFYYYLIVLLAVSLNVALAQQAPTSVKVDGVWYTNGQIAYIECGKSSIDLYIAQVYSPDGINYETIAVDKSSNFGVSYDNSNDQHAILTLDAARQDGFIKVYWQGYSDFITIYVRQKPPVPTFNASPILCSSGNSATYSVSSNYSFQGSKPINIIWQTTGGITVNGSSTYTANSTTSSSVTVQYNSFGTIRAYAIIPGCSNLQSDFVSLYIGLPSGSDITFTRSGGSDPGSSLCSGSYYNFMSAPELPLSSYSYNWSIPSGSSNVSYFYSYGPNANIGAGSAGGGFVLQMSVTKNGCSGTGGSSRTFFINSCSGFRVAQNPATDQLTILFDAEYDAQKLPDALQLANEKNGVVTEKKVEGQYSDKAIKAGLSIDIDIHNLPRGTYYLRGIYGADKPDKTESIRIILK